MNARKCFVTEMTLTTNKSPALKTKYVFWDIFCPINYYDIFISFPYSIHFTIVPNFCSSSTESLTKSLFQFFDADSLLPPPFTFLSLLMYTIKSIEKKTRSKKSSLQRSCTKKFRSMAAQDIEYRSLIFSFIDNFKPQPDSYKGN